MRLLQENVEISPSTFYATILNTSCSAMLLATAEPDDTIYLVVAKCDEEVFIFFTKKNYYKF